MEYRNLGRSGLQVSVVGLGCNNFGMRIDAAQSAEVVHKALDLGINFFDTADIYGGRGKSEEMLGAALKDHRRNAVIATKFAGPMGDGPLWSGASRRYIFDAVDDSLRRLGTDYIDLYQIHRFDTLTNLEDTMRALDDLVRAGKVRYIGCSNLAAWQMMKSLAISREQHLERFRCTQSYYSLAGRELEHEIVPFLKDQHLGLLVWSPLAGGFLSGKFTRSGGDAAARRASFDFPPINKEKAFDIIDVLALIAGTRGVTVAQVALAWLLAQSVTTSVIIGARRMEQLDDNLKSVDITLTPDELKALDDVSHRRRNTPRGWAPPRATTGCLARSAALPRRHRRLRASCEPGRDA